MSQYIIYYRYEVAGSIIIYTLFTNHCRPPIAQQAIQPHVSKLERPKENLTAEQVQSGDF